MKSLVIIGRKWFDKVNGNTYHTSEIIIDGEAVHKTGMQYGYGEQYVQTASQWLKDNNYIISDKDYIPLWQYCRDNDIKLITREFYVLKREL